MNALKMFLIGILVLNSTVSLAAVREWNQPDWIPHSVCPQGAGSCLEVIEIQFPLDQVQTGVALLIPGFTQNGRFWDLWPEKNISYARHLMNELGIKVYLLNPRGIGNSDPRHRGNMDDEAIEDIPAALEFVAGREHEKILVFGHSQGGITLLASLSGLTRASGADPVFSREVALQRQALVRGAIAVASNVTMRSELPANDLFHHRSAGSRAQKFAAPSRLDRHR